MNNEMTENDWLEIDNSSRCVITNLLSAMGASDIGDSHGNCSWDISCVIKTKPICIEIKDRNMPHTKYSDMMVEQIKQDCNNRRIDNGQFKDCLVASVYSDNVICLANINDKDAVHKTKYCKRTTLVKGASHDYIQKEIILLPQRKKVRYEINEGRFKFSRV